MDWLKRLLARSAAPAPPILLRVMGPEGLPPPLVDVALRWQPSGRRVERSFWTADGLCVIPWRADEHSVALDLRGRGGRAALDLARCENPGRVIELGLRDDGPDLAR